MKNKPKRYADVINIWYSPHINKWSVCVLVLAKDGLLKREKNTFSKLQQAVSFVNENYKDN